MPVLANKNNILISNSPVQAWVRPAGWLDLPTITSGDTKISGLVAVYENQENAISIQAPGGSSQNYTINWGDGTSQTGTTTNSYTKRYDYSSVSSIILQDSYGYNYKQVIVTITNNSGTVTNWNLGATATQAGPSNWLDISFSWSANILISRYAIYLQRLQIFKATLTGNINQVLELLTSLRFLRWESVTYSGVTSATAYFNQLGNLDKMDFSFSPAVLTNGFFQYTKTKSLGNISFAGTTTAANMFFQAIDLEEIGTVDLPLTTTCLQMFYACGSLSKLGRIITPVVTTIQSMFVNCSKLREINFSSCSAVTTTTSVFSNCVALEKLRMPSIGATFSITGCNLQRPALIDLFNDLASVTAKTITITNNPGVADLTAADLLIATSKGWTVTQ